MSKEITACFTGHRPEKFANSKTDELNIEEIKSMLYYEILDAVKNGGYRIFISGMAKGVDLWACGFVMDLKRIYPDIKLVCAMPYRNHGRSWHGSDKYELNRCLQSADEIVFVSENYDKECYKRRNQYMVDRSSLLIGICQDERSGTGQTIRYAISQGIKTKVIKI